MKAEQMFEKLGFEKEMFNARGICYKNKKVSNIIWFQFSSKTYWYWFESMCGEKADGINIKTHKAIHQQLKELGWLDE